MNQPHFLLHHGARAARLFCGLMAAVVAVFAADPAALRKPNIVFILADDLGYGDLGCYGQKEIQTPNIDQLAKEGMRFTQFYAGSCVCAPSRNVLMTGQHSGHILIRGNAKLNLAAETVTVAEMLKENGYTTGLMGKWGLGAEKKEGAPTRQGFDTFFGYVDQTHAHNYYPTFLVRNEVRVPLRNVVPNPGKQGQGVATVKADYSADLIGEEMLKFVDANKDRPFFLYFASTQPHANDEAKELGMEILSYGIYEKKTWPNPEKGYAAMITQLDRDVGRLMSKLKALGLDENTIVFFTSDNGPHKEGGHDPAFFHSSGPLRGIKRDLYEGGIREPMIVRWPGHVTAGSVSNHVGYFGDFFATAAELAGGTAPTATDSLSFLRTIKGETRQAEHPYLYWESYEHGAAKAVLAGNWKATLKPVKAGKIELYDLSTDLAEARDVAAAHPEIVSRLREIMDREHGETPLWPRPKTAAPDSEDTL